MPRPVRADVALAALCSGQKPPKGIVEQVGQHDCCSSHASPHALPLQQAGIALQAMQPVLVTVRLPGSVAAQWLRPRMRDPPGLPFTG
ncbi:hypothetical protein IGB42_01440 [Andreprevotia sp. IGB-42]|uniref:hypothetical protein n=1 Tax=Andreprevotia sp. IGB-42 TaxID=2497473 RepID=UPI00135C4A05|nr:hypothetical protein [Andreprevotia sp. IGB-42]KAF0813761.1 hypothetical protein IGB42_01440 [Andreprevotia sp. IGB-42]